MFNRIVNWISYIIGGIVLVLATSTLALFVLGVLDATNLLIVAIAGVAGGIYLIRTSKMAVPKKVK